MDRRSFIRSATGLFVAAAAAPIVEPVERVRRWWQVGAQLQRPTLSGAAVAMQLEQERALRVGSYELSFGESPIWVNHADYAALQREIGQLLKQADQAFEMHQLGVFEYLPNDHPAHTDSECWARGPLNRWEETVITKVDQTTRTITVRAANRS